MSPATLRAHEHLPRGLSDTVGTPDKDDIGSSFERTAVGKVLTSVLVVALAANMAVHASLVPAWREDVAPVAEVAGLHQTWTMFAKPPSRSVFLRVDVEFADGTVERWRAPSGRTVPLSSRAERWRKWAEKMRSADQRASWVTTGRWIVRGLLREGTRPVEVRFVETSRQTPPVGGRVDVWRTHVIHTIPVDTDQDGRT
jgi:hypothetical protein